MLDDVLLLLLATLDMLLADFDLLDHFVLPLGGTIQVAQSDVQCFHPFVNIGNFTMHCIDLSVELLANKVF